MALPTRNHDRDGAPVPPLRLARLVLLPALPRLHTARERLEAALGPELTRFLVAALATGDAT